MKDLARRSAAVLFAIVPLLIPSTLRAQQATPPPPPRRPAPSNQPASPPLPNRTAESVDQRALDLEMLSTVGRRDRSGETQNMRRAAQLIEDFVNRVMKSFLENPVFHVNSPNDTELRSAAGSDLEAIISLSQTINKVAKTLSKTANPNK